MAFLIYSTWPNEASAKQAMSQLLQQQLIACANIAQPATSIYRWQGEVCSEKEVQVWMKTGTKDITNLRKEFLKLHPYEIPAFLAIPIEPQHSHGGFIHWLEQQTEAVSS